MWVALILFSRDKPFLYEIKSESQDFGSTVQALRGQNIPYIYGLRKAGTDLRLWCVNSEA